MSRDRFVPMRQERPGKLRVSVACRIVVICTRWPWVSRWIKKAHIVILIDAACFSQPPR